MENKFVQKAEDRGAYDKQDVLNFEIANFPFLDGDVPRCPSYGVYISHLIRFARVCSNIDDSTTKTNI